MLESHEAEMVDERKLESPSREAEKGPEENTTFITGVQVTGAVVENPKVFEIQEVPNAQRVDQLRALAVVDTRRIFAQNDVSDTSV